MGPFDYTEELKSLPMPTLVLASDGDVFPPTIPRVKKMVAGNKRIRFHVTQGPSLRLFENRKGTLSRIYGSSITEREKGVEFTESRL